MPEPTALARKEEFSLAELGRRIDLNVRSGWGLNGGTSEQLNALALYCQRHRLWPGDEVTLYEGRPWITVEGRVTLMRRNPEYRGYAQRPLTRQEKEDWGYDPEDIVVETTVRTTTYGEIKAYGKVSKDEKIGQYVKGVRHNPVAQHNPVEMAQKRSLGRAERVTFGTDSFVDDDELEDLPLSVVEEQRVRLESLPTYEQLHGSEEDMDAAATPKNGNATAAPQADFLAEEQAPPSHAVCEQCEAVVMFKGDPINEAQADELLQQFGGVLCKTCRPKNKAA